MPKIVHMKRKNFRTTVIRLLPCIISLGIAFPMFCYLYTNIRSLTLYVKPFLEYDATGGTKVVLQTIKTFTTLQKSHTNTQTIIKLNQTTHTRTKPYNKPNQIVRQHKCTGCFSESIDLIINNEEICKPSNEYIDILIMIMSSPQNMNKGNIRYVFLLGESQMTKELEEENFQTMDIILGSFKDTYNNLTYKTMMSFQWATKHCRNAQFVMKTDDDVYVHIPGLKRVINENANALQNAVGGSCQRIASPIRDKRSKWYASFESYPEKTYPGYCSGTGYVTSLNVITKIVEISKTVPFFHLEDVYFALCIKKWIKITSNKRFYASL